MTSPLTRVLYGGSWAPILYLGGIVLLLVASPLRMQEARAQQPVPESVRQELQSQGMTPAEARRRAQQLGIDLSNPQQAIRQARERGIPEARIQALVRAARQARGAGTDSTTAGADTLKGGAQPTLDSLPARPPAPDSASGDDRSGDSAAAENTSSDGMPYFGYQTFNDVPEAFKPSPTGPVDDSYVVGPGDELRLVVWGAPEFQYNLTVDRQGRVYVPNHGQFTAAGKQLSTLRADMKQWLGRQHSGLVEQPQTVFMDLSITRIQPIRIYVLGAVARPGGYTVSAMSNAFNALYSVGGPLKRGSLRRIQVIRDGEISARIDLYDYLVDSRTPSPVPLQNGDYLRVPVRGKTVAVTGAVERPGYYELKDDESLRDLVEYAGGLEPDAYTQSFRISRLVPPQERDSVNASVPRRELTFDLSAVMRGEETVDLADADRVQIRSIPSRNNLAAASRVESAQVSGAVYQPGEYTISDTVRTVRGLIRAANGLTDAAYRKQASLIRINEDLGQGMRTINIDSVMAGVPRANIPLAPGDSLHVPSVKQLEGRRTVRITGQVRNPGSYPYRTDMTVADLLLRGGGLADSTYLRDVLKSRADLYRPSEDGRSERVIPFNLSRALQGSGAADRRLRPGDRIRIYPLRAEANTDRFVEISGAVKSPGEYDFQDNLTLKDLILRADGFAEDVYLEEIEIARPKEGEEGMRTIQVPLPDSLRTPDDVSFSGGDTADVFGEAGAVPLRHRDRVLVRTDPSYSEREFVTIRGEVQYPGEYALEDGSEPLSSILERAGGVRPDSYPGGGRVFRDDQRYVVDLGEVVEGERDLPMQGGDRVFIPPKPNSVSVRGNVARPGLFRFEAGEDVEFYLERAGGRRDSTQNVFLTQANGATFKVDGGWFSRSPDVTDGAVIRVTRKPPPPPDDSDVDVERIVSRTTGIISGALTLIVLAGRAFGN